MPFFDLSCRVTQRSGDTKVSCVGPFLSGALRVWGKGRWLLAVELPGEIG